MLQIDTDISPSAAKTHRVIRERKFYNVGNRKLRAVAARSNI